MDDDSEHQQPGMGERAPTTGDVDADIPALSEPDRSFDHVEIFVDQHPSMAWAMVADLRQIGRFSPECFRCTWIGPHKRRVGGRFLGWNRRGKMIWVTMNRVEVWKPREEFAFRTTTNGTLWRYTMDGTFGRTILSLERDTSETKWWMVRLFSKHFLGGAENHEKELREGMMDTLRKVKAACESNEEIIRVSGEIRRLDLG